MGGTAASGNWARRAIESAIEKGASAEKVSMALATSPRFIAAVREAMENYTPPPPGVCGGNSLGDEVLGKLSDAFQESGFTA